MGCLKKLPQFRLSNLFSKSPMQGHTCLFLRALLLALPTKNNYQIILLHPHPTQNTPSFPSLLSFSPSSFTFFIHSFTLLPISSLFALTVEGFFFFIFIFRCAFLHNRIIILFFFPDFWLYNKITVLLCNTFVTR